MHRKVWEINVGAWTRYDAETTKLLDAAEASGITTVEYSARRQDYRVDLASMEQVNRRTGVRRAIRCIDMPEEADEHVVQAPPRSERLVRLVERLVSPAVQMQLPIDAVDEPARLTDAEVRKVFVEYVPGVEGFLYQDRPGQHSLEFITSAYRSGLDAFKATEIHGHLLSLLRLIVHHGCAGKSHASRYLREVADAFMDCQAVQGRVIERVGLEIQGVSLDFRGLLVKLVGDYKAMALKMLAVERASQGKVKDSCVNPTHYENRLIADLADPVGFNKDDVRLARLDEHAAHRFEPLRAVDQQVAIKRFRELFDIETVVQAFVAEVNAFDAASLPGSLPHMFLGWASRRMTQKHVVLDEATCSRIEVAQPLALAIFEVLFLEELGAPLEETYRGIVIGDLFLKHHDCDLEG